MEPTDGVVDGGEFASAQRALFDAVGLRPRETVVTAESSGARLRAYSTGRNDGVPWVFVHGTGGFGAFLAPLMAQFSAGRSITFDRPGYGLSDPAETRAPTIRDQVVTVIGELLDGLGIDTVDLVGHSMGGHASLAFALAHPDRVRRLATVGSIPGFPGTAPPIPLRAMTVPLLGRAIRWRQRPGVEGVLDVAEIFGERDAIQAHPELMRALAAQEADPAIAAVTRAEFAALFTLRGWRPEARFRADELAAIEPPTTVIWGENDPLGSPAAVRDAVDRVPRVRFETVEAGHIPFLAHPERCAAVIDG